jgi:hypothetical protein
MAGSLALQHIESLLRARKLDGTLAKPELVPETAATGLAPFDQALGGGWRRGAMSELTGPASSGRTSLLVITLAAATARGEVVGLVDGLDRFDPAMAASAGVDVSRVLWVRGTSLPPPSGRSPSRGAASLADLVVRRALRAADLIVRAGGFGVVVLDLADVPIATLKRVPPTSWLRLSHANEGRDTVCLLVADAPIARSPRGVSVRLSADGRWSGPTAPRRRLDGLCVQAVVTSARHTARASLEL